METDVALPSRIFATAPKVPRLDTPPAIVICVRSMRCTQSTGGAVSVDMDDGDLVGTCTPCVYLLQSTKRPRRTYVGCTCCSVRRRLRQHNGEICGGAKQTETARPWVVRTIVSGFRTRQEALQFEFAWRRVHRRGRHVYSLRGRCNSLQQLCSMSRWSRNAPPAEEVPLRVVHLETA